MDGDMRFEVTELSDDECCLQREVRDFLASELPIGSFEPSLGMAARPDVEFSRKLAARGWIGMALPREYGGGGRSAVERFIVVEELLRWGAPVGHHWFADRQSGPLIARFGTNDQKKRFLPSICAADISFCVGMSEPDSGSDLSSVKTRATRVEGGWELAGTKVWTTGARYHDWMVALVRSSNEEDRHRGLSQVLVNLHADGVMVSPIPFLDGTSDFNEVVLDDVFVPDDNVLGTVGEGWSQIGSELTFERSGPERWLSTYLVVEQFLRELDSAEHSQIMSELLGSTAARLWVLRNLSLAVAREMDGGGAPAVGAALVKEMATRFEQDIVEAVLYLVDVEPCSMSPSLFERLLSAAVLTGPSFTIRGGTIEVLRSVVAKTLRS